MSIPAIQLLVARWYPGSGLSAEQARLELQRRGWSRFRRWALLAIVLPSIAPDRILRRLDPTRDTSEETGAPHEVTFSALFSLFAIAFAAAVGSAWLNVVRHDSGKPDHWFWLVVWVGLAAVAGYGSRAVARRRG